MIQTTPTTKTRPQPNLENSYDVVVIGGGPAGSTVAALVAEQGRSVLLLERTAVPRFHVGESLIPETYWPLERLGLLDRMRESAFPKKFSVQFVSEGHKESAPFYFDEHNPHESSVTWQVERGIFDEMLIDRAVELGASCRTDAQVLDVMFTEDRAKGVRVKTEDGTRDIACQVVIDASGQSAFLASRLNLRVPDPKLRMATIWTYYENAIRGKGKDEGATLILQTPGKKSWFWYIPLPDNIVSIGCTGTLDYMFGDKLPAADVYERELKRCPALQRRLEPAQRVADHFTTKDFSYTTSKSAGSGWLLVGDAGGFIDPVYSSGVFLALKSGWMAADAIAAAFKTNDFSETTLGSWVPEYRAGVSRFRKLVYAFYSTEFSFGSFLKQHPEYHSAVVDILIGNVFKPELDEMFEAMGTP
ncbi:NAD(P)/FAD-dependent oxidoreductase [Thalassoroseus pseudoceratinae]|uniref:NAD(P)/FAD-dependent oxidoreductase n=1 Tax=Thalassoroseus pseudoceratinae TaxID=2713176 RepID=UPI00141EA191|nr:NAD(P)/FAD-dependent oxidoreductase [Thalassoroseus pseudoceratinae]